MTSEDDFPRNFLNDVGPAESPASEPGGLLPEEEPFSFAGATGWLNSPPLTGAALRGRVVLVNFWTYTCINWLRALPYVRAWEEAYRRHGLVVIGVHSPEFSFEHDVGNVRPAMEALSIGYPVAVDNSFRVWRSFDNHYWPAVYLVDAQGRLRHTSFGEGGYDETEAALRRLLTEAGAADPGPAVGPVSGTGIEAAADWKTLRSAETYLGYQRTSGFASPDGLAGDSVHAYTAPPRLRRGQWALAGSWRAGAEAAVSEAPGGRLFCRFHARDVHLVAAPAAPGSEVRLRVMVDGREPGAASGLDIDPAGYGTITRPGLYQLLRRSGPGAEGTAEIEFLDPGAGVYCFTFG
ncbi:redoxin domain-containing protein [Arthrobacter crusticola]|uniref:Redoxin domain-containing protein n=1 Tax=Arthrobacter crusticola TaxID=2547960 RepID=A0A4R5TWV4_9MICC|nr:redoxin domain-containing protein [Arthrobacter crusticola]TDK25651.1 redoxin domain-containing protein [Arthrobacter crusticola]